MADWDPYAGNTIGLTWFPTSVDDRAATQGRAVAMTVDSTAAETIDQVHVGYGSVSGAGYSILEVFEAGDEVPGATTTASFVPNADLVNSANLWQNSIGNSVNVYDYINNGTTNPASYATYQGTYTQKGNFQVNYGTAAWAANRRVLQMRLVFTAAVQDNFGRLNVRYYDGTAYANLGQVTLSTSIETYTVVVGELEPIDAVPWTQAQVVALDGAAGFGWQALSGASVDIQIYDARLEIDYVTEDRVAVGVENLSAFEVADGPQWVTYDLVSNWSKANTTTYTFVVRPVSAPAVNGVVTAAASGTVRTLDSGVALPTGSVSYLPTLDQVGSVAALGDSYTFGMALALDINASATDSADGMPYIRFSANGWNDQTFGNANGGDYSLMTLAFVDRLVFGITAETAYADVAFDIIEPGPTTIYSGTISASDLENAETIGTYAIGADVPGNTSPVKVVRVELDPPVTLAAATTYTVSFTAPSTGRPTTALVAAAEDIGTGAIEGTPATYGGTTWDYAATSQLDAVVTLSIVPATPTGFEAYPLDKEHPNPGPGCSTPLIPYTNLVWNATSLGADFGYYQIQRSTDEGDTWSTIAQITTETVTEAQYDEAPFNKTVWYRMRVIRTGDLIASEWTDTQTVNLTLDGCPLVFSTNLYPDYTVAYDRGDTITWEFPSAANVALEQPVGADYHTALIPSEWRGDTFAATLKVWSPGIYPGTTPTTPGVDLFDPLNTISRAQVPYVCVRDETGHVWYANVRVETGTRTNPQNVHNAEVVVTEVTDTPAVFDVNTEQAAPFLLLRTTNLPQAWTDLDDIPNEGTAGPALPAVPDVRFPIIEPGTPGPLLVHTSTNIVSAFTTPYDAAFAVTGDIDLRARWRAIGDAEADATETFSQAGAKILSLNTGTPGYDEADYGLAVGLTGGGFVYGELALIWHDTSNVQHVVQSTGYTVDPYSTFEARATLDVDDGAGNHAVTFYEADGAGGWTQVYQTTIAGTTDIRDNMGPLTAASFSVDLAYFDVYDGIDGTLAATCSQDEVAAPKGENGTWTASTGEVWTIGEDSSVLPVPLRRSLIAGASCILTVFDDDRLDPGASDDWTWMAVVTVPDIADANLKSFGWIDKSDGVVGAGGRGWLYADLRFDAVPIDGAGPLIGDGPNAANSLYDGPAWSAGERHVVAFTVNRTDDELNGWIDGVQVSTASLSSVGSLATTEALTVGQLAQSPHLFEAHAQWDRLLSDDEIVAATADIDEPEWPPSGYRPFLYVTG